MDLGNLEAHNRRLQALCIGLRVQDFVALCSVQLQGFADGIDWGASAHMLIKLTKVSLVLSCISPFNDLLT